VIAVLDDLEVVLVEISGAGALRGELTRRMRFPAHISATGRSMLAHLAADDLDARLERIFAGTVSGGARPGREALLTELHDIRMRGYAVSDREVGPHNRALAAAVRTRSGTPLAAVGIVVRPPSASVEELVERYAARIMLIAERIFIGPALPRLTTPVGTGRPSSRMCSAHAKPARAIRAASPEPPPLNEMLPDLLPQDEVPEDLP